MKKILSLTLSAALLSAAAPGYAIDLSGNYANDYENLETAVNGKVDSSTIFSNGVFDTQNTNANGTVTRIWNEADGGGTQIIDGRSNVKAYTGVHEGSDGTNIYVQTYAIDKDNKTGTRINVNKEGAYYTTGKNTYTFDADDEIATKGDLKALASGTSGNKISTDALDDTLKTAISTVSTNTTAINTNKDNIAALQTTVGDASSGLVKAVADNTSAIATNTTDIAANSTVIASLQTTVAGKQDKLTVAQQKAVDSGITDTKVANYDGYDARITANTNAIATINNSAVMNSGIDSTKVGQIATNKTNIDANTSAIATINNSAVMNSGIDSTKVGQIATNKTNIDANTSAIATINNSAVMNSGIDSTKVGQIATNKTNIDANTNAIATINNSAVMNSGIDSTKVGQIETNKTNIATNTSDILGIKTSDVMTSGIDSTKVAQITTNANNIAALDGRVTTNTNDIVGIKTSDAMTSGITAAKVAQYDAYEAKINGAEDDIDALQASVGDLNYTTNNYVTDNDSLTTAVSVLDGQMKTNADGIEANKTNIGNLLYANTNYVASGDNLTTAVGKLDGQVKTNADGIATNATNIGSMDFTGTNYLTGVSSLTDATKALDGQVKTNADNIGDMSFTGTSAAGATTLTGAVNKLDAAIGNKTFITNASGATDVTDAINKTNTALGDVSTLDGYNITTNNVTGAVNELDAAIGDVSTLAAAKGRDVKTTADVTSAIKAMDADFHRADDGRIHIGTNSFILDDSNGNFSYEDPNGVERPINFTQTPTVNGTPLATTREVDHLRDESRTGIASVAALTALQPLGIESGRLQFAVGSGFYQGESALAAGANYYVTDNLVLNAGGAMDTSLDNHVIKAGLSVGFFKPKKARTINANNVVINAAQHTTVKASKDVAYVTPEQLKALMDRIEVLEKELAKRK